MDGIGANFTIDLDVFNVQVAVFDTDEQRIKTLASMNIEAEAWDKAALSSAHMDVGSDGQAWFSLVLKHGVSPAIWAHECVHIADYVMDHLGIPTDASNTEIRAYIVGHLFAGIETNWHGTLYQ